MSECWRCGQEGHRAGDCEVVLGPPPPARDPREVFRRRPEEEIADAHARAAEIRRRLGWEEKDSE